MFFVSQGPRFCPDCHPLLASEAHVTFATAILQGAAADYQVYHAPAPFGVAMLSSSSSSSPPPPLLAGQPARKTNKTRLLPTRSLHTQLTLLYPLTPLFSALVCWR